MRYLILIILIAFISCSTLQTPANSEPPSIDPHVEMMVRDIEQKMNYTQPLTIENTIGVINLKKQQIFEQKFQNLADIHPWLNDPINDFVNNVNNDINAVGTPYTLEQLMDYLSWTGLEQTQDYIINIQNELAEFQKQQYVNLAARTKYTHNCN